MTNELIQTAIAEACGPKLFVIRKPIHDPFSYYRKDACGYTGCINEAWKVPMDVAEKYVSGRDTDADRVIIEPVQPADFPNDLNAMHEAVKRVIFSDDSLRSKYYSNLHKVCGRDKLWESSGGSGLMIALVESTAAQRAEALMRALGRWKEEKQ